MRGEFFEGKMKLIIFCRAQLVFVIWSHFEALIFREVFPRLWLIEGVTLLTLVQRQVPKKGEGRRKGEVEGRRRRRREK